MPLACDHSEAEGWLCPLPNVLRGQGGPWDAVTRQPGGMRQEAQLLMRLIEAE